MNRCITSELIEAYSQCRRRAFLLLRGDTQTERHDYDLAIGERQAIARSKYLASIHAKQSRPDFQARGTSESHDRPELSAGDLRADCDALLPSSKKDNLRGSYEPHLVLGTASIGREDRIRLAFAGYVVADWSRICPNHGVIVPFNAAPQRIRLLPLYPTIESITTVMREWAGHLPADPPSLVLNRHCQTCPFHQLCVKEAKQNDSLSLLERMTPKLMQKYGKRGIFSINQLSYAYRPRRRRRKRPASAPPVFNIELQAMAIRTGKIILHDSPSLPSHRVELFLDIEGLPDEDFDYLIGVDVREGDQVVSHSFWADSRNEEGGIFRDCMELAARYPNAPIFHYGSYEPRAFARIAKKSGVKCDGLMKRLVNVNSSIYGKVYFPTRSNGLKDLAAVTGATWSVSDASGLHSIAWRWRWEDSHKTEYKELLLAYNRDDCHALHLLTAELQGIGKTSQTRTDVDFANNPKQKTTSTGDGIHRIFEGILKAAHTEYRQKRICIRPAEGDTEGVKPKQRRQPGRATDLRKYPSCIGKTVHVPRKRKCPRHPTHFLTKTNRIAEHPLLDLKFTRSGVRKTVVRYVGSRAHCPLCNFDYLPPAIRQMQSRVYGHGFQSWAVYQHVALRLPYRAISSVSDDLFGENLAVGVILKFLTQFAVIYASTERSLLQRILSSPFVHADETTINIKGMNQYVWVLTNGNHVVFRRTETRESTLIQSLLANYGGVLISDFYGGYDALKCRQQKCLVHLIRDLNDDLWKNPFNREYELFVGVFRDLLVPIFADIDRYGLKSRHLHKHQKGVDQFYRTTIEGVESTCEIVAKYQKRFLRFRESIFRFLNVDGLPWNNNTAEQAIRHLAVQRKISGSFAATGADEYLRLLGISQTCRFQDKSFLKFLLSGEMTVDGYLQRRRRR